MLLATKAPVAVETWTLTPLIGVPAPASVTVPLIAPPTERLKLIVVELPSVTENGAPAVVVQLVQTMSRRHCVQQVDEAQ